MSFSQSDSSWSKPSHFLQLLWWWLMWSFCSNVLWGFGCPISCSIHSFSCSLLCSGHFRCWLEQGVLQNDPLLRHLSSQKSQPSIGSIFYQLIILVLVKLHSCCWADCVSRGASFMIVNTLTLNCTYKYRISGRVYPLVLLEIASMISWPVGSISISHLLF